LEFARLKGEVESLRVTSSKASVQNAELTQQLVKLREAAGAQVARERAAAAAEKARVRQLEAGPVARPLFISGAAR
jgi:transcription elongation GreA/GreB family factor